MRKKILFLAGMMACCSLAGAQEISKTWVADKGNGTYQNPVLHADYSDPDVCAAGDDFYMTASSFNCIPGIPILHSNDLVNWSLVNYALPVQEPEEFFDKAQHGKGVWAPAIRFHNGEFYIYWGDPDYGIYMIKAKDPKGRWSKPVLVKAGKGMIDPTPLWDEDGKVYLVHAYAGSRSGVNSIVVICELNAEGTEVISDPVMVFDGNDGKNHTVEGPKLYKRNGYYYIFAPAGGVATGWQLVLRSKNIYGPYESKIVMAQGKTNINGPHQGGLEVIKSLRDYGFKIEIDDFGSGYSSLNMLKDISADVLKIDMAFLRATENEVKGQDILETIISLGGKLGMEVITEGVETDKQLIMLTEMGCHIFQGYYFSKPIPVEEFEQKYMNE